MFIEASQIKKQFGGSQKIQSNIWLFSLLFCLIIPILSTDRTQTIKSGAAYKQQRACAQQCFWSNGVIETFDPVASVISCKAQVYTGALDSCWCRIDVQPGAESHLSNCVESSCASRYFHNWCLERSRKKATVLRKAIARVQRYLQPLQLPRPACGQDLQRLSSIRFQERRLRPQAWRPYSVSMASF